MSKHKSTILNMKKILFLILLLNSMYVNSQSWEQKFINQMLPIDSVIMEVQYSMKYLCAKSWMGNALIEDTMQLQIGKNMSRSYCNLEKKYDVKIEEKFQRDGIRGSFIFPQRGAAFGEVYNNYPENKITVMTYMDVAGTYIHLEDIPDFNWKIGSSCKTIMGYKCYNALCYFRGRCFEAWFTTEVPFKYGPWKFGGLPGLILELSDTDKEFCFECIGVQSQTDKLINYWQRKYIESNRKKTNKTQQRFLQYPGSFLLEHGQRLMIDGKFGADTDKIIGYMPNLIEKE